MAYNGYLLKVGTTEVPMSLMQAKTYKITPNQRLDVDSFSNANLVLQRKVADHTRTKIEFTTVQMLNTTWQSLWGIFSSAFISNSERDLNLEYYDPETNSYKVARVYMPDTEMQIYGTYSDRIEYLPIRIAFIEY